VNRFAEGLVERVGERLAWWWGWHHGTIVLEGLQPDQKRREEGWSLGQLLFVALLIVPIIGLALAFTAAALPFLGAIAIVALVLAPFVR
jgi:hypothetical protein